MLQCEIRGGNDASFCLIMSVGSGGEPTFYLFVHSLQLIYGCCYKVHKLSYRYIDVFSFHLVSSVLHMSWRKMYDQDERGEE